MTLVLAQVGSVQSIATSDGLLIRSNEPSDLSTRAFWPSDSLKHPDGLQTAIEIEQCLDLGYARSTQDGILIPYESFPELRRSGITISTRWVEWCPFLLKIDRLSDIGRPAFQYRYLTSPSFCTTASERVYITANGCEIGFVGTPGLQAAGAGGL